MLSIGAMAAGQDEYYLDLAREDYYLEGGEPPGRWWGSGAHALGLTDTVQRDHFRQIFEGFSPSGTSLVQNAGHAKHQPGWDLTFSAPKSVSVLWSQSPPDVRRAIQEAHLDAVKAALRFLEETASFSRRGKGGATRDPAHLIVALFEHGTSRELDPQLHTHCLAMNVALRPDGTTGTLMSKPLYLQKMAAGALYRAELASQLAHRLDVQVYAVKTWFEIAGVPHTLIEEFSKRRAQILKTLSELGLKSASAAALAALSTRHVKELVPPREELFKAWQQLGEQHGFTVDVVHKHPSRSLGVHEPVTQTVTKAIGDLVRNSDVFRDTEVLRRTAERSAVHAHPAASIREAVQDEIHRSGRVVSLGTWAGRAYCTTTQLLADRTRVLRVAAWLAHFFHGVPSPIVGRVVKRLSSAREPAFEEFRHHVRQLVRAGRKRRVIPIDRKRVTDNSAIVLDAEHAEMVRHLTRIDRAHVRCIDSANGPQHLLTLRAVATAYEKAGYRVIGVSPSRNGVAELQHGAGIVEAKTLRGMAAALRPPFKFHLMHAGKEFLRGIVGLYSRRFRAMRIDRRTVIILDDAQWLGTERIAWLMKAARRSGSLLIMTGSTRNRVIEPPTMFAALVEELRTAWRNREQGPSPTTALAEHIHKPASVECVRSDNLAINQTDSTTRVHATVDNSRTRSVTPERLNHARLQDLLHTL